MISWIDSDQRFSNALSRALFTSCPSMFLLSSPADALPAVEIQDHCEIDMLMNQLNICDIRSPDLVWPSYLNVLQKVWIYGQTMIGIGCYQLEFLLQAQKIILAHKFQHTFAVCRITEIPEFSRNPPVTIAGKFKGN